MTAPDGASSEREAAPPEGGPLDPAAAPWLVACIFTASISGLIYELVAGTLSSYLLGDTVTQFSLVIGIFLTSMGLGSWLSGFVQRDLEAWFVGVEVAAGLVGGWTAPVAFAAFAHTELYSPVLVAAVGSVGVLVGLEIPLIVRILGGAESLRTALARVMAADYLGALAASLLFPFVLLPHLGLMRASLLMGLVNVGVAAVTLHLFSARLGRWRRRLTLACALAALTLVGGLVGAGALVSHLESRLYQDEVVLALDTPVQRLVLTRWRDDLRLYLNGHLQFSSVDEHRYHEALVHPAMAAAPRRARVLILGGGDGLAAREVLAHPGVERVDLVDLDPVVTGLFSSRPLLTQLNRGSLTDPRVHVHNTDALRFLEASREFWDVVVMDLPDPSSAQVAKLYARSTFQLIGRRLSADGVLVTQATSPFRSREAFWCIRRTIAAAQVQGQPFQARAYQTVVPTFGTWGFVIASARAPDPSTWKLEAPARYLTPALLPTLFVFPADMDEAGEGVSELDDPVVSRRYRQGYHQYLQ